MRFPESLTYTETIQYCITLQYWVIIHYMTSLYSFFAIYLHYRSERTKLENEIRLTTAKSVQRKHYISTG